MAANPCDLFPRTCRRDREGRRNDRDRNERDRRDDGGDSPNNAMSKLVDLDEVRRHSFIFPFFVRLSVFQSAVIITVCLSLSVMYAHG